MKTFAEFQILGRIGKIREVEQTTRVSICANYAYRDRNGDIKDGSVAKLRFRAKSEIREQ